MSKIGFIGSYRGACELAHAMARAKGLDLVSDISVLEDAVPVVNGFLKDSVYPIIARIPTSKVLIREFGSAIVELNISNYAFLRALNKAKAFGKRIIFVDVTEGGCKLDIQLMEKVLDVEIVCISMTDTSDGEQCIRRAKEMDAKAVVSTAACLRQAARDYEMELILIDVEEESLSQAMDSAASIARVKTETDRFKTFIDNESDAILTVDNTGCIQIFNHVMSQITELPVEAAVGVPLIEAAKNSQILDWIYRERRVFEYDKKQYIVVNFAINHPGSFEQAYKVIQLENPLARGHIVKEKISSETFRARYRFSDIVSLCDSMGKVTQMAKRYARTNSTILLTGESGVGKEIFAQSIHNESAMTGPFVAINCASLPEHLIESELYGYEEGSFTGAKKGGKLGLFELSNGGTLFLDEIGEIPLAAQARLLRSIQERQIIRIGGNRVININNRIICATNRDLKAAVEDGAFREDLFYRINILYLRIPPLRERKEDIGPLAKELAKRLQNHEGHLVTIPEHLLEKLKSYHWPGNVRELESFLERLIVTCEKNTVDKNHFDLMFDMLVDPDANGNRHISSQDDTVMQINVGTLEEMNQQIIKEIYRREKKNVSQSAVSLGISRATLWRKLNNGKTEKENSFIS